APETSAPLARSLIRPMNFRTTGSDTSASSSASRISRAVASMSAAVRRPLLRSPSRAEVNRSESDSNTQPAYMSHHYRVGEGGPGQTAPGHHGLSVDIEGVRIVTVGLDKLHS